jgi:curved DNA-binding protein CbpA
MSERLPLSPRGDLYGVLGVTPAASTRDIKEAFHRRALETHPDKLLGSRRSSEFVAVREAAEVLMDPCRRGAYDSLRLRHRSRAIGRVSSTFTADEVVWAPDEHVAGVVWGTMDCRCGGQYRFLRQGDAAAVTHRRVHCECDSCSLLVEVSLHESS